MALNVGGSDSLYWRTGLDTTGLQAGAVKSKGILAGLSKSITRMDIFAGLAIGSALVFAKISKQAYNFSKEFETAMKEVQTISKAVQNDFKGISKEIIAMSKTVPDNAQKLTKALYQIVSAGYDGAEAMDILRTSTELAVASVTDTFTAADALTYVMNAYGEAAGTASDISDKLFTIVRLGKVKMEELGPTISMVTGLAAQMGLSFNELAAIYAEAVKKLQPHIATTGIRGIITAMLQVSKGTGEASDAAKELGIEFDVNALKAKGFKEVLKDIIEATKGNEAALARLFPNVRGLAGLLSIMTGEGEAFNKTLIEIENSTGATEKAFKTMVDTTENQLAILHNNVMAKLKPLGDFLLSAMNDIASGINIAMSGANDEMSKLARTYSELIDTLQRKQSRIDDLITTIEGLRSKTELTREETTELEAAERALATFFPTLGKAAEDAAGKIDILSLAKEATIDLSIRIMEIELAQAEIEKRRAKLALTLYGREEDAGKKEINRIKGQMIIIKGLTEYEIAGVDKRRGKIEEEIYTKEKLAEMVDASLEKNVEYQELLYELSLATEKRSLEEEQLTLNIEKTTSEVDALTEAYKKLVETREKPPGTIIPLAIDIEKVKDDLKYMADQYRSYWKITAQEGEGYVEEHNAQMAEDAKNYGEFLSDMLVEYKGNAELTKEIMLNIAEYNKEITEKRKKAEEEYFNYITEAREKELESEKDRFKTIIKNYKEGSDEYLKAVEKHNKNVLEINEKYDKEIAEAALVIFKEGLEKQIGETDKLYTERLRMAKAALGEEIKANEEYFKFIEDRLYEIAEIEKAIAEENREALDSYLSAYKTTEEKIVAIKEKTAKLLTYTDNKYEQDRLKSIEKILIAEIKFSEAKQKIDDKNAEYIEELNNKELEKYIKFLEEMKLKYSKYADIIILLNGKIADSQKQLWENTRDEIEETVDALHALADVVGNFDSELSDAINNMANLISGISGIAAGFATANIVGIISGIAIAIESIVNLFRTQKSYASELKEELAKITLELQHQQNILNQSVGSAQIEAIKYSIALLEQQIAKYKELIIAEQEAIGYHWWDIFHLFPYSATDQEVIDDYLAAIESTEASIASLNQQYQEILTGTDVTSIGNSIADAIVNGFSQGLPSAQVFATTFNNMMRKAIIDAFKRTIITKYIEGWYDQFVALSGGGLTTAEIEALASTYQNMIEGVETQWEAIAAISEAAGVALIDMAGGTADITGLTGAIAGITEETAGLLAGQFQAIRINTVEVLTNMESIIIINSRIADNTEYNKYLTHLVNIENILSQKSSSEKEDLRGLGGV